MPTDLDDRQGVVIWRYWQLVEAKCPPEYATLIADRTDIDLHEAVELVKKAGGRQAADILL